MRKIKDSRSGAGFTLIEILIVVAIIAILAAVVLAQLWQGAAKARDAKRYADLREVELALEAYGKTYDRYPSSSDGNCTHTASFGSGGCLQVLVTKGFFSELPTPPNNSGDVYHYDNWCRTPSGSSESRYRLWTTGEEDHDGLAGNWWNEETIGFTSCTDPS